MGLRHPTPMHRIRSSTFVCFAPLCPMPPTSPPRSDAASSLPTTTTACALPPHPRRTFLRFVTLTTTATFIRSSLLSPHSARAESAPSTASSTASKSKWRQEDLCASCEGRGRQTCSFCEGLGSIRIDDSIVEQYHECPNCQGSGYIGCPACIGLGLAEVSGILRNGARDGTLRMLRNGTYEILDCSAFPACDIYGTVKPRSST